MTQRVVTLRNSLGHALHCIWQEPTTHARRDVACVLLSPGVKMRVAPHRMYRKFAQDFLERGIGVLRVDFHGLGDSEGELPEVQIDQLYRKVQQGRHVPDVRAALDGLEREFGIRKFIVGGLCGGAVTGLLAAESDPRVVGLYAIGIPVTLDGPAEESSAHMTRGELATMRNEYLKKLTNWRAWSRLFSFKSDFRLIFRSATAAIRSRLQRRGRVRAVDDTPVPSIAPASNFNTAFARAFFRLLRRGTPALLVYSGADRLYFEFREKFAEPWAAPLKAFEDRICISVVAQANHVLGDPLWVSEARAHTAQWLDRRFC